MALKFKITPQNKLMGLVCSSSVVLDLINSGQKNGPLIKVCSLTPNKTDSRGDFQTEQQTKPEEN